MPQALDTLAASRKLEDSGMPERQAEATVEVVSDAMSELVTKEHLTTELNRQFAGLNQRFAEVDRQFAGVNQRFAGVDRQFAGVNQRFAGVDRQFTEVKDCIREIDAKIDANHHETAERFLAMDAKIDANHYETGERLGKMDAKIDSSYNKLSLQIAELGKSQAWGFVYTAGMIIGGGALLFAALRAFPPGLG